jgi:hypothetical protein
MLSVFRTLRRGLAAFALAAACAGAGSGAAQAAESASSPNLQPAIDGVLAAFATHPLVSIGEHHGLAQDGDFYNALVLDPRFAREVGNVVVEFGSAAHQGTLDRYLAGEEVPYPELREVWTDLIGFYPASVYTMYPAFFAQVRRANMKLPPDRRIKVWLGDPGVDFTRVKSPKEAIPLAGMARDAFAVALIEREILAHGRKAVLIYGYPHFHSTELRNTGVISLESIGVLLDRTHPGSLFRVEGYAGVPDRRCEASFEGRIRDWPRGSLVSPVKGTWLVEAMYGPQCKGLPYVMRPPGAKFDLTDQQLATLQQAVRDTLPDALIYFGPEDTLTLSPITPDVYMDPAYVKELNRRSEVLSGNPLTALELTGWATRNADLYNVRFPQLRDK